MQLTEEYPMHRPISRTQLQAWLDAPQGLTLVEALPRKYYDAEHLPGAINIPHDQIHLQAAALLPDRDATVVVYCANTPCQNSRLVAEALTAMGYAHVYEYVEGKQDWKTAGLPLEGNATAG
jgi:rhodanese-related sulfurtransferase